MAPFHLRVSPSIPVRSPYRLRHCPSDSAARLRAMFTLARSALSTYAPPRDHAPPSLGRLRQLTGHRARSAHGSHIARATCISTRSGASSSSFLCHRPHVPRAHRTPSCRNVDVEAGCCQPDRLITTSAGFLVRPATDRADQFRTPALRLPSVPARTIRRVHPRLRRSYPPLTQLVVPLRSPALSPQSRCRSMA